MKIKQILLSTAFLVLGGCVLAQNNDNLRGRINDRPNQAVQRRTDAPQKEEQRMPEKLSDCQRDGLRGEVQDVLSVMYESDAHVRKGSVLERLETVYNQKGQRRSQAYLSNEEDMIFKTKYKHDGFGLVTLEHILDPENNVISRTYYLYDADLILTEIYVEDEERQIESRVLYKYDAQGRVSQRSFNDHENNVFRREIYVYGDRDNIFKTVVYNGKGKKVQEISYEYDEYDHPVSSTLYDYNENDYEPELTITLYEYRYDDNGNWIVREEYQLDNDKKVLSSIVERDIKYFAN